MTTITERRQQLDFDRTWVAFKWDQSNEFKGSQELALQGSNDGVKAVDVVAVRRGIASRGPVALVCEFKDFDHPNIPAAHRPGAARQAASDQLLADLVRKVIDSLCGATFAHDAGHRRRVELNAWSTTLTDSRGTLVVLFCIEIPRTQATAAMFWTKKLQQRLRWLGPQARVIVTSSHRPYSGGGVTYRV